jgi:tetratricopeptide (TPR) repeat protein
MPRIDQRLGFTRYEADEHYRNALNAYHKGDFDNAIESLNQAIDLLPTRSELYAARGFIYLEDGETQQAIEDFEDALKLYPYEMLAHYGMGMIAYHDGDWDKALEHFNRAYYADSKRPETNYYLGLVHYHKKQFARALELMTTAQAGLEAANHKQKNDAARWVRELTKLAKVGG